MKETYNKEDKENKPKKRYYKKGRHNGNKPGNDEGNQGKDNIPNKNDWHFYAASEEIAKDIASIPFNYMGGTPFGVGGTMPILPGIPNQQTNFKAGSLHSIMRVNYVNAIGVTDTQTKGINMAATQLYTFIRHANSGARNYEAADVMMYVLAMRDIYSQFFMTKKVLGYAGLFNYYNHNYPDALIKSMDIDPVDLRHNLAQYRGSLNLIAKKINSFAVPKYFKIFDRAAFINSYLFGDSSSIRGQAYQFFKSGYYTWSSTTSEKGTELVYHDTEVTKFSDLLDILNEQLDALFLDEDALTMSGDILKAFGDGDLYQIMQTPDDYITPLTMDEDILAQIENSIGIFFGKSDGITKDLNITQQNQIIKFVPKFSIPTDDIDGRIVPTMTSLAFNSHKDNPQYNDVLEWTRLMTTVEAKLDLSTGLSVTVTSCGLEIVLNYQMYRYDNNGDLHWDNLGSFALTGHEDYNTPVDRMADVMQFDWHPLIYTINVLTGEVIVGGDLKVATVISKDTLERINDAAVYGALYGSSLYNSKK